MKIIGVIPARYGSSRFPGKPLQDICGKPMLWWVYNQAKKVEEFADVYVATDDDRIMNLCRQYGMNAVMTGEHSTHIARVHELSTKVDADYYVNVNGDEPLIEPATIRAIIPKEASDDPKVFGLMKILKNPVELIDPTNIKVAANKDGTALYISRAPIPHPYKTILFEYKKNPDEEKYTQAYMQQLNMLTPEAVYHILHKLTCGKDCVLLCYEKAGSFCHRNIVAKWMNDAGYAVAEWKK